MPDLPMVQPALADMLTAAEAVLTATGSAVALCRWHCHQKEAPCQGPG